MRETKIMYSHTKDVCMKDISLAQTGRKAVTLKHNGNPLHILVPTIFTIPFSIEMKKQAWSRYSDYSIHARPLGTEFDTFVTDLNRRVGELLALPENSGLKLLLTNNTTTDIPEPDLLVKRRTGLLKMHFPRNQNNGLFTSNFFTRDKTMLVISDSNCAEYFAVSKCFRTVIECSRLWFFNNQIGCTWDITKLRFEDRPVTQETASTCDYTECILD